ncbi:MAG: family transposase [Verrucomicrobiota bacterium]|nr:family transposase [Verrucomicrobiota bacterium]
MSKERRQHSAQFKPLHAIAAKRGVHPVQVSQWKKEVAERLPEVLASMPQAGAAAMERENELYEEIDRLRMELGLAQKAGQIER